jgi:hypothetical protein
MTFVEEAKMDEVKRKRSKALASKFKIDLDSAETKQITSQTTKLMTEVCISIIKLCSLITI